MEEEEKDSVLIKKTWAKPMLFDEKITNTLFQTGGTIWDGEYSGS